LDETASNHNAIGVGLAKPAPALSVCGRGVNVPQASMAAIEGEYDVCVVGAGPAGLACAFACRARAMRVLVLEAGGARRSPGGAVLDAEIANPLRHDPIDDVMCAGLGGTSLAWSGRALPFDAIDFRDWPISYEELAPHYRAAADFLGCHDALSPPAPGAFAHLERFDASTAESFCAEPDLPRRLRASLNGASGPVIALNARVARLRVENGIVAALEVRIGGKVRSVRATRTVIACGGLSSLRLLLLAQRETPSLFGGEGGPLGRGYMGHLTGAVADMVLANQRDVDAFRAQPVGDVLTRRQIRPRDQTIARENIGNIGFWLEAPSIDDASHGSAAASAKYLIARAIQRPVKATRYGVAPSLAPHFANVARKPSDALTGLARGAVAAALRDSPRGAPAPLTSAGDGGWRLAYHAEQSNEPNNRVSLGATRDRFGDPRLKIEFDFSDRDISSVVHAHDLLDADLRAAGAGHLRWIGSRAETEDRIRDAARDGYHQLGGAIMGDDPRTSVVDKDCRAHGVANLWVASSCVFPTSSRANPTLTIVALAHRIAGRS